MATQPLMYTLHIELHPGELKTPVWRRIVVTADCTLRRLHHFIQAAFGWESRHLHLFISEEGEFMAPDEDGQPLGTQDDRKGRLRRMFKHHQHLRYFYDMGDDWEHVITVEEITPVDEAGVWCELIGGAGACPLEDSGGALGYEQLLAALSKPKTELGRNALEWARGPIDPTLFDPRAANAAILRLLHNYWG